MKTHKTYLLAFPVLTTLLLLSACGTNTANTAQNTPPLQVLQNSYNAMKHLKSAHFTMQLAEQMSLSGQQTKVTIAGSGDEVLPNKADVHLSTAGMSISTITIGREVYFQNSKGQWYLWQGQGASGNPFSGTNISSYNTLLALASKAHFIDHGMQTLNGQSLRHITVTLDKNALQQIISSELGNVGGSSATSLKQLMSKFNMQNTALDLWIDPTTYYVVQMDLKFTMNLNTASFVTPATSSSSMNMSLSADTTIDFSKFNAPISITAPGNAIPTSNLSSVFGAGG